MPVPPVAKKASSGLGSFLKGNAEFAYGKGVGLLGGAFLAADIKNILDSDNKLKALLKTAKDFILIRIGFAAVFKGVGDAIKGLVRDTGSLDAALKKLSQMQQYARQFSTFAGGLNAAKQRMSELHTLSLKGPFKFEELAEANKSLEVFTRGAYSSVQATQEVGKAALASGNNIQDTARAVGMFYDNLRSGVPIRSAAEQLRQMGLITQSTADQLTTLNETGADTATVFNEFTKALNETGRGAAEYKDTLEGVTAEHEKALNALKEGFGAPFTQGEIQNTKNMTRAMQEITPTVEKVAKGAAMLYGGFSTATSGIVRFMAGSKIVQGVLTALAYAFGAVTVAAGAFGSVVAITLLPALFALSATAGLGLSSILVNMGVAFTTATQAGVGLALVLRTLSVLFVGASIGGFVLASTGAGYSFYKMQKQVQQALDAQRKGWAESTSEIGKQIAAVSTLQQKNEALTKALQAQLSAEKDLAAIKKKRAETPLPLPSDVSGPGAVSGYKPKTGGGEKAKEQERAAEENVAAKKRLVQEAIKLSGLDSEHLDALIRAEELTKAEFEDKQKSVGMRHEEVKAALDSARSAELRRADMDVELIQKRESLKSDRESFAARGKSEEARAAEVAKLRAAGKEDQAVAAEAGFARAGAPEKQSKAERQAAKEEFRKREADIASQEAERIKVGLEVGNKQSSTYLQARVEQLQHAQKAGIIAKDIEGLQTEPKKNENAIKARQAELENERKRAQGMTEFRPEDLARTKTQLEVAQRREAEGPALAMQKQQVELQRFQIDNEISGQRARARGDIVGAKASENLSRFTSHFDQLFGAGFGKKEAAEKAFEQTSAEIEEEQAGHQLPVDYMRSIGGGGALPAVDASLEIARQQMTLQQKMVDYLAILSGQDPTKEQTSATFQP
jgi:hypothetical protein